MNLNPVEHKETPEYPTSGAHLAGRRKFLSTLGKTGLALGLCGLASRSMAGKLAPVETEADKKKAARKLAALKIEIAALSTKLDNKDFKIRKSATEKLIEIGAPQIKDGKDQNEAARVLILEKMSALNKHKDPEVKARAKQITVAITPKPVKIDHPHIGGVMIAPRPQRH